jgi:BppU N-terminal domain
MPAIIQALTYDLYLEQNSTFQVVVQLIATSNNTPFNLTGYTMRSHIRKHYKSTDIVGQFECVVADPLAGKFYMLMSDEQTRSLPAGNFVYDIVVEDFNGNKYRAVEGALEVSPYVTY